MMLFSNQNAVEYRSPQVKEPAVEVSQTGDLKTVQLATRVSAQADDWDVEVGD